MQRCLDLAGLGLGSVSPNPMVGAVLVCDGLIIGEGYHQIYGGPHAEVNAIQHALSTQSDAAEKLRRSVLYVSLEPCSHTGKTPPCADLIISHGIPKVVIGCTDPFDAVNGSGIKKLAAHGIEVTTGILEEECRFLNRRFFTRVLKQRPYIILKWAQTANGYFAPKDGSQKWITSALSKQMVHRWRAEEDAVLVGRKTALIDNPRLDVREWAGKNPIRVVIDRKLELPDRLNLFDQSQETLVFNSLKTQINGNVKFLELENLDTLMPQMAAYQLYLRDIQSVIIEGGAEILNQFISAGLWDEIRRFTSADSWTDGITAPVLPVTATEIVSLRTDRLEICFNTDI